MIKELMRSYIMYTVQGELLKTPLIRSLHDFITLRNKLRDNWPGVLIPMLPNEDDEDKDQSQYINYFCDEISKNEKMINGNEIKSFLSTSIDLDKEMASIPNDTIEDLGDKYEKEFKVVYLDRVVNYKDEEEKIKKAKESMQKINEGLNQLQKVLILMEKNAKIDNSREFIILSKLREHEQKTIKNFYPTSNSILPPLPLSNLEEDIKKINSNVNPFTSMLKEITYEIYDTESIIDSIISLEKVYEKYQEMKEKLNDVENKMKAIVNNEVGVFGFFKMLITNDDDLRELQNKKMLYEMVISSLKKIIKFCLVHLNEKVNKIKEIKIEAYYKQLQQLSNNILSNNAIFDNIHNAISKNEIITTLKKER